MMGYIGDFLVEDGVVKRYIGIGGELIVPEGVREIGESAFITCAAVSSVVLPEGVEIIRRDAFSWRTGLLKVELPHSLRIIEEGAFEGCSSLETLLIPEGVRQIDAAAFYGCQELKLIEIPQSLQQYEDFMDVGCITAIAAPGISLKDIPEKYRINAAHGYACLVAENRQQPEDIHIEYMEYIRREIKTLSKRAMKSMPLLQFLMAEELIEMDTLKDMLSQAIESKDFELTAGLLDYQGRIMTAEKLKERLQEEEQLTDALWEF